MSIRGKRKEVHVESLLPDLLNFFVHGPIEEPLIQSRNPIIFRPKETEQSAPLNTRRRPEETLPIPSRWK
jgi:hypothetical protein